MCYVFKITHILLFFYVFLISHNVYGYKLIKTLNANDRHYTELVGLLQDDTEETSLPELYEYKLQAFETLETISKRTGVTISSLISLNRSNSIADFQKEHYIIIPSHNGVFLPISPRTDLEFAFYTRVFTSLTYELPVHITSVNANISDLFYYLPTHTLSKSEINLWMNTGFRKPVLAGTISSYFGSRKSPISGNILDHKGVDITASSGDEIFSIQAGEITKEGYNSVFGFYIIITHDSEYESLYGHLLDIVVSVGDTVRAGQLVAYMGSTGMSTGSHIHFEIHKNGVPIDPLFIFTQ